MTTYIDDHSINHNKSYILIDIWDISELLVIAQWHFQATWSTISFPENYVAWKLFIGIDFHILTQYKLVFGLGRIFKLERSAIFMTEFRARLELGAINFHQKPCMFVYMGEKRFPLWSYHIGTVLKRIQLSFTIYRVSNHQWVHDRAGVKYVLSNTNTNTNTPVKIWSNTNTNTAHQIQIQIHTEAETKLPPFYRWHIQIPCTVRRLFQILLKIVSKGPIYHYKPPLAPIMAWRWVGNKPLSDLWWPSVLMHKCITRPKWVNVKCSVADCYLNVV